MNSIGLSIALLSAREWALNDPSSFSRFFVFSQADRQWLLSASDDEFEALTNLPTSLLSIDWDKGKGNQLLASRTVPTASIGTVTTILTAVADDLSHNLRVGMINWGIVDLEKARWLSESTVQDRLAIAMTGQVKFALRCSLKRMNVEPSDATARMATLMRILAGKRRASN